MKIVIENISLFKLMIIIVYKFKYKNLLINIYLINDTKINFIYNYILKYLNLSIQTFDWDFFKIQDNKKRVYGQLIKNTIAKHFFYLIKKKNLSLNFENFDQKNFEIFFIKDMLSKKWFLSDRTISDHFLIINAIEKLIKLENSNIKIIYLLENFPFVSLLHAYNLEDRIEVNNFNNLLNINLYKKIIINIFFNIIIFFRIHINNFGRKNLYFEINNRNVIIDTDMLMRDPEEFHDFITLDTNSYMYVSDTWYIDDQKSKKLKSKGIDHLPIEIYPSSKDKVEKFYTTKKNFKYKFYKNNQFNFNESIFYNKSLKDYNLYLNGWYNLFKKTEAKIFFTHNKFTPSQIAASAAIRMCSGVSATMQNSFQEFPFSNSLLDYDLNFCFTNHFKNIESSIGSRVKYQVAIGYTNDYKFNDTISNAKNLRNRLIANGAKKIICFFDQGSKEDKRWSLYDQKSLESYEFLFKQLLNNNWMGLIIKPKKPGILETKLSKIGELYERVIKTNRCIIIEETSASHIKNFEMIPACISMASDFAIHDTMVAGTAGLESALTNTPCFFLDIYNYSDSIFYSNDEIKIVYNNFNDLWISMLNYFNTKKSFTDLHWHNILDKLDPYRDNKSNYRIEQYLSHLNLGFEKNYNSIEALEFAAEKFAKDWGDDKIITY